MLKSYIYGKGAWTEPVNKLHQQWDTFFSQADRDALFLQICTSQGAQITGTALGIYPENLRKRIRVVAFAPLTYIPKEICHSRQHYIAEPSRDRIPYLDVMGFFKNLDSITVVPSHPQAPLHDHSILSPTFTPHLRYEYRYFLKMVNAQ